MFFRDFVNLRISLVELDCKIIERYNDVKNLINGVDGFKGMDVLNGIPFLNLASQIFDGMIKIFGSNKVFFKENAFRLSNCLVMSLRLRNDHGS